jgi:hypothetical protein
MRHERLYLSDIVEAADFIAEFIANPILPHSRTRSFSAAPLFRNW